MQISFKLILFSLLAFLSSCIGDDVVQDFVDPEIRLNTLLPETLAVGEQFAIDASYFNTVGQREEAALQYESTDTEVAAISAAGVITANSKGQSTIIISAAVDGTETEVAYVLTVDEETVIIEVQPIGGTISTTSSYLLTGDFAIEAIEDGIRVSVAENYQASTALPGLYIYLTNNRNTNVGALEVGRVQIFEGAHSYDIPGVALSDYSFLLYYCKPFSVKVGDGAIN